jgi:hypothetical protein
MNPVSRQDVQNIVDIARNRIMERMVTRQDLMPINDCVKNLLALHQQSQQLLKQSEYQRSQLTRRVVALETHIATLENDIRVLSSAVVRAVEQRQQPVVTPTQVAPVEQQTQPQRQPVPGQPSPYAYPQT